MKRTIVAVLLVLAIAAVGYWGAAGWQNQNREWHRMQAACEETKRENQNLQEQKTALEKELTALEQQNGDANETLQSWKSWKEELEKAIG